MGTRSNVQSCPNAHNCKQKKCIRSLLNPSHFVVHSQDTSQLHVWGTHTGIRVLVSDDLEKGAAGLGQQRRLARPSAFTACCTQTQTPSESRDLAMQ
jgi:hypothetical protein